MQSVKASWYKYLNLFLGGMSLFVVAGFFITYFIYPNLQNPLGLNPVVLGISIVHLVYSLGFFWMLHRKQPWTAGLLSLVPVTLTNIAMVHSTGSFESIYFSVWIILTLISGIFGIYVISGYLFLVTIYFILLTSTGDFGPPVDIKIATTLLALSYIAAGLSYLLWRRHYKIDTSSDHVVSLSSELEREQLKSEILINAIADTVIVIDTKGAIQLFNPAAGLLTGWKQQEAMGLDYRSVIKLRALEPVKGDETPKQKFEDPFAASLKSGQASKVNALELETKSGKRLIVSIVTSPIKTGEKVSGVIGVLRDVSEEKRQERQRAEFISTASHEMRTPVAAIEGYLALAMNDRVSKIDSKARSYLEKAHESTQHLGELFRDLLTAAKSEDGRLSNHPKVIDIGQYLEKIVEDMRFTAEKKGLKIDFVVAGPENKGGAVVRPLYYVYVDPERIREVFTNLISNSIKFTEEGGITVGLRGQDDYVQLSVRDTGLGIPPEDIPHLFQKFYRVDNSATRSIGGTGLGLFISRSIIEMYKGQIWVESQLGQGSTFYINLPRLSQQKAEELKKKEEAAAASDSGQPDHVPAPKPAAAESHAPQQNPTPQTARQTPANQSANQQVPATTLANTEKSRQNPNAQ